MARRRRSGAVAHAGGEESGSERWLVTYADMLTVMLALFIVLFAIYALNQSKFKELKYSLAAVFGDGSIGVLQGSPAINDSDDDQRAKPPSLPQVPVTSPVVPAVPNLGGFLRGEHGYSAADDTSAERTSATGSAARPAAGPSDTPPARAASPADTAATAPATPAGAETTRAAHHGRLDDTGSARLVTAARTEVRDFTRIEKAIHSSLVKAGMAGAVDFAVDERGLIITVVTNALVFPGNSATLLRRGETLLSVITPPLTEVSNNIEVDGFTNQLDVSTAPYPSGWELSSARASTVVRYLQAHGLGDRQLSAVGFSDQRPLVPPSNPKSVTRNRRVEIVVLSSLPRSGGMALTSAAAQAGIPRPRYATGQAAAARPGSGQKS
jgi:chemotaxis protein MotB